MATPFHRLTSPCHWYRKSMLRLSRLHTSRELPLPSLANVFMSSLRTVAGRVGQVDTRRCPCASNPIEAPRRRRWSCRPRPDGRRHHVDIDRQPARHLRIPTSTTHKSSAKYSAAILIHAGEVPAVGDQVTSQRISSAAFVFSVSGWLAPPADGTDPDILRASPSGEERDRRCRPGPRRAHVRPPCHSA